MDPTITTLLIAGAVLMFVEIFLPGMVCGIAGFVCLIVAVALSFSRYGTHTGIQVLLGVGFALVIALVAWFKYFPKSRMGRLFVAKGTVGEMGLQTGQHLHQTGVAHTALRPSGIALLNGKRVDVVTEGSFIESGTEVKVVAVEGLRVVVRAVSRPEVPVQSASESESKSESTPKAS